MTRAARAAAVLACGLIGLAGCTHEGPPTPRHDDSLIVFAAASLRDAFTAVGRLFTAAHPGVALTFNFAGTQELRTQIENGAGGDVLASADQRQMDALAASARVEPPVVFAHNEPVAILSASAPPSLASFRDLPAARRVVIGAPDVPIGRYTQEILRRAGERFGDDFSRRFEARIVSRELNVRQVLAKVRLGDADAGIVYRSDAHAAPELRVLDVPRELGVVADYPMAVVRGAPHADLARAWIALVMSPAGQGEITRAGLLPASLRGDH